MIRKISFGVDYKNAMHYTVGQGLGNMTVHTIRQESPNEYSIYLEDVDGSVFQWKTLKNMPVVVEFDIKSFE